MCVFVFLLVVQSLLIFLIICQKECTYLRQLYNALNALKSTGPSTQSVSHKVVKLSRPGQLKRGILFRFSITLALHWLLIIICIKSTQALCHLLLDDQCSPFPCHCLSSFWSTIIILYLKLDEVIYYYCIISKVR